MPGIPGPSVLTEDSAESLLSSARANAQKSLQQATGAEMQPLQSQPHFRGSIEVPGTPTNEPPMSMEPPPDAIDASTIMPPAPPADAADPAVEPFVEPSIEGFLKEEFAGTGKELGNGIMRGFASLGGALGTVVGAPLAVAADKVAGEFTGKTQTGAQDALFDTLKNYVDTAYDSWHAEGETGGAAQVVGHVGEMIPALTLGPAAAPALVAQTGTETGKRSIDEGQDAKTAAMLATTAALATYAGMKLPLGSPSLPMRLAKGALANVVVSEAQSRLTRQILKSRDYREAAAKIDPNDPATLGEAGLIGAIFGAMAGKGGVRAKKAADQAAPMPEPLPAEPPPNAIDPAAPPPAAPPAGDVSVTVPTTGETATAIPDRASAEPLPDLQAQIADLDNPQTPRRGVYLSADNVAALGPKGVEQLAGGRPLMTDFDGKGGTLIVKDNVAVANADTIKQMVMANPESAQGADPMQYVIGQLTDAGTGKQPGQTAVVQGQTPAGAVASEAMVTPEQVPARVAQMQAEGKIPVVTDPVAAIARREGVGHGRNTNADFSTPDVGGQVPKISVPTKASLDVPQTTKSTEGGEVRERGVVKTGAGERAVFIDGPAKEGKVPVRLIDDEGNASEQVVHVPESSIVGRSQVSHGQDIAPEAGRVAESTTPTKEPVAPEPQTVQDRPAEIKAPAKESTPQKADITYHLVADGIEARSDGKVIGEMGTEDGTIVSDMHVDASHQRRGVATEMFKQLKAKHPELGFGTVLTPNGEAFSKKMVAAGHAKQKATKVQQAIGDQLGDAMDTLRSQEIPPSGKKFPASVKDRAGNIATFARALKAVAQASDAPAEIKARALTAARAAERLDLKSDEAIAKNQGVGHSELTTHAENMLNAAELLRNPEAKVGEVKAPKAEKLKARIAKPRSLAERQAGAKPHIEKVAVDENNKVKVIEDVPDETKPKELNKGEKLRLKNAGKKLIAADDSALEAERANLEHLIDEIYEGKMHPDDRAALLYSIEAERRDRLTRKTRDEEVAEEFSDQRYEREASDDSSEDYAPLPERDDTATGPEWKRMAEGMLKSGSLTKMAAAMKSGQGFTAKSLISHMAGHLEAGPMRDFIAKVIAHLPDGTHIVPVEKVIMRSRAEPGGGAGGLFDARNNRIQVRLGQDPVRTMQVIVHEAVHAATVHFVRANPNHALTLEMERLRMIAEKRARAAYTDQFVDEHLNYYNTTGPKPKSYTSDLYGLTNLKEFMSEVMTNPVLQEVLIKSERYKQKDEGFIGGIHNLARSIFDVVRRMLGLDVKEGRLLEAAMRSTEDVMEAQHQMFQRSESGDLIDRHGELRALGDEPKAMRGEELIRRMAGDAAAKNTTNFYRSTRAGVIRALRKTVLANETHDQIIRSNAHWFGNADDAANPLRQYDEAQAQKAAVTNRVLEKARDTVHGRTRLNRAEDKKLGQFQIDSTLWGIDPSKPKDKQTASVMADKKFEQRWADFQKRWTNLSDEAKAVYKGEQEFNQWAAKQNRKAAIDAALDTFSDKDVTSAQRQLLYSVRNKVEYDSLIGDGKLIDVGERNKNLIDSLGELAGLQQRDGPYFHLGRHGDYVVQVEPEGSRDFATKTEAESYAARVKEMGPGNKAKVAEIGGKWNVATKIQYVSMHENSFQAEQEAANLRAAGYQVGHVTQKVLSKDNAPLSAGIQQLVGEATRKLERHGSGDDTKAMSDALRQTFVTMTAARSAYAASKLARRGFSGVKGEEMGRNFASHAQSMAWNTGNLATVFKQGEALGRVREAAKNPGQDVSQQVVYKRGAVMDEIGKRMQQEVSQYGLGASPVNAVLSKLGFLNFLASPAHTAVNLTQNFTTAIPIAVARYGGRAVGSFSRSMRLVGGPSFRAAIQAHLPGKFTAEDIASAVAKAVAGDATFGKWVKGGQLQQLMDRGVIGSTFAHEISTMTSRQRNFTDTVFDYARILPQMAEVYNRVSTALAGLELNGGDVAKAADFVHEAHLDYSQGNKSRVFKSFSRVPGGNAVLMFKTYVQGMAHLLYGNVKQMVMAETKSRAEAAKTVAALIVAQSIFAGVIKGALLEPLRLGAYAYNKLFGDDDEYSNLDNMIRKAISSMVGKGKMSEVISGGVPRALGFDLSSRMGLSDLFLHNPPDLLAADSKEFMQFVGEQLGPMPQMVATQKDAVMAAIERGDTFHALMALVPVKAVQDMDRAFTLASQGKKNMAGGQLTPPSTFDAAVQALGVKPASVARAQERTGTAFDYRQFTRRRQKAIVDSAGKTGINQGVWRKVQEYNRKNPGNPITVQDFIKQQRAAQRGKAAAQGGPERDPKVRKLLDY